jgi:two-component system, chemotaxis family, chemotaxis protein CheY
MKLMIVDDSSIMRKAIEKYLSGTDIEIVGTAGDGLQAIELFKKTLPDVVTLDITMPEMDGLQCLDELLKIKADTRIMVVSALKDESTALEALKKGARSFLGKPFTPESIREAFEQVISD